MFGFNSLDFRRGADENSTADAAFDVKVAYGLTLVLSFLLWWVPGLGQAAAGFVGGRRAGSVFKGVISGACSIVTIFIVSMAFTYVAGVIPANWNISGDSLGIATFFTDYMAVFVNNSGGVTTIALNPYALLMLFSVVGGVLAGQARREMEIVAAASANANRRRYRSAELFASGKRMGFESYDNCLKISVNTMNPVGQPRHAEIKDAPQVAAEKPETPKPETKPVTRPSPVTSTLDMSSAPSTATSADDDNPFAAILRKSDKKPDASEKQDSADDFEYI